MYSIYTTILLIFAIVCACAFLVIFIYFKVEDLNNELEIK